MCEKYLVFVYFSFIPWGGLWCLTPLSPIFQLYRGGQFYWWRKLEYPEKTTDLSQVTDKLYNNVESSTPRLGGIRTLNVNSDRHWLPYDQHHDGLIFLLHEKLYYKMLCKLSFIDHNYDFFDNADNTSKIARGDILLWIPSQSDVF